MGKGKVQHYQVPGAIHAYWVSDGTRVRNVHSGVGLDVAGFKRLFPEAEPVDASAVPEEITHPLAAKE